jgi:hypothetical protein
MLILNSDWNCCEPFFSDILEITWRGSYNIDFISYWMISGLWIVWREKFSAKGILLFILNMCSGILFFAPYLFILSYKVNGDWTKLLLEKKQ